MNEQQRQAQVEMLLHRVVRAEAALQTIKQTDNGPSGLLAGRTIGRCMEDLEAYLRAYPDSRMCKPY